MAATSLPPLPGEVVPEKAKPLTLCDVGELYCAYKGKHDWVPKTSTDTRRVLTSAEQAVGADKLIRTLDAEDVKAVRDLMARLPPNYAKYKKNANLDLRAVLAKTHKGPVLSVKTQDKYFGLFKSFLHWAADENYIDKMAGQNVKVAGVAKLTSRDKRLSYSTAQLNAIFGSPLFSGHKTETMRHRPGKLLIRDGKFWVPLVALYGLAAYAYTRSAKTIADLGRHVEAGMLSINHHGLALPELPFGGVKDSGYGSEGGTEAMDNYVNTKLVTQAV